MWGEHSVPMRHFCETNVFVILAYSLLSLFCLIRVVTVTGTGEDVLVQATIAPPVCSVCECPILHAMAMCGGCRSASYCSDMCHRIDWPVHRPKCTAVCNAMLALQHSRPHKRKSTWMDITGVQRTAHHFLKRPCEARLRGVYCLYKYWQTLQKASSYYWKALENIEVHLEKLGNLETPWNILNHWRRGKNVEQILAPLNGKNGKNIDNTELVEKLLETLEIIGRIEKHEQVLNNIEKGGKPNYWTTLECFDNHRNTLNDRENYWIEKPLKIIDALKSIEHNRRIENVEQHWNRLESIVTHWKTLGKYWTTIEHSKMHETTLKHVLNNIDNT